MNTKKLRHPERSECEAFAQSKDLPPLLKQFSQAHQPFFSQGQPIAFRPISPILPCSFMSFMFLLSKIL